MITEARLKSLNGHWEMEPFCRRIVHQDWLLSGREVSRLFTARGCLAEGRGNAIDHGVSKLGGKVVPLIETVEVEIN